MTDEPNFTRQGFSVDQIRYFIDTARSLIDQDEEEFKSFCAEFVFLAEPSYSASYIMAERTARNIYLAMHRDRGRVTDNDFITARSAIVHELRELDKQIKSRKINITDLEIIRAFAYRVSQIALMRKYNISMQPSADYPDLSLVSINTIRMFRIIFERNPDNFHEIILRVNEILENIASSFAVDQQLDLIAEELFKIYLPTNS